MRVSRKYVSPVRGAILATPISEKPITNGRDGSRAMRGNVNLPTAIIVLTPHTNCYYLLSREFEEP